MVICSFQYIYPLQGKFEATITLMLTNMAVIALEKRLLWVLFGWNFGWKRQTVFSNTFKCWYQPLRQHNLYCHSTIDIHARNYPKFSFLWKLLWINWMQIYKVSDTSSKENFVSTDYFKTFKRSIKAVFGLIIQIFNYFLHFT